VPVVRAAIVMMVLGAAAPARAETPEAQVERLATDAVTAYRGADYNRAVELLTKAYEIRQVPALLYNLAKAYDKLGDVEHAGDAYHRYVSSLDPDPKLKAKAEARLQVLDEQRRKTAAERAAENARATAPPRANPEPAPRPATVPQAALTPPPQPVARPMDPRLRARWTALGFGIATVAFGATGAGLGGDALARQHQYAAQYGGDEDANRALKNSAIVRANVADAFFALTAASAAVTAYFLYRGYRKERAPSLSAAIFPAGAYIAAEGRF
jgi:tetratricopeptide (TPR) repeat protein